MTAVRVDIYQTYHTNLIGGCPLLPPIAAMAAVHRLVQNSIMLHFDGDSIRSKIAAEKIGAAGD